MEVTTLSYTNLHNHGELFANMFRARHRTFIQQAKWDLPEADNACALELDCDGSDAQSVRDALIRYLNGAERKDA